MPEDICPVQWTGRQAVVTLPQHIDGSNAGQIREQLLWTINRGAAVLVADLAATVSCDYSGADALVRAYHRAVASGTELELVVMAHREPVRGPERRQVSSRGYPLLSMVNGPLMAWRSWPDSYRSRPVRAAATTPAP